MIIHTFAPQSAAPIVWLVGIHTKWLGIDTAYSNLLIYFPETTQAIVVSLRKHTIVHSMPRCYHNETFPFYFGSSPIHKSSSCRPSMQPERLLFSTNDHCLPIITLWLVERAEEYVRPLGKTPGIAYEATGEELFVWCGLRQFSATLAGSEEFYRIIPRTMFASANNLQKYWCQQWLLKIRWPDSSSKTRFPQWLE